MAIGTKIADCAMDDADNVCGLALPLGALEAQAKIDNILLDCGHRAGTSRCDGQVLPQFENAWSPRECVP